MVINFRKKGDSGIIPFVSEGKEKIHCICTMKSLWLSTWAGQQITEKFQNGCHLKLASQNH